MNAQTMVVWAHPFALASVDIDANFDCVGLLNLRDKGLRPTGIGLKVTREHLKAPRRKLAVG